MSYAALQPRGYRIARPSFSGLGDVSDCKSARVTKVGPIDDSIEKCCEGVKKSKGKSPKQILNDTGECIARGLSAAGGVLACTSAGAALGGVGAAAGLAIAPLCGTVAAAIGGFVYDRVSGYSDTQKVAGGVGAAVCGIVSGGTAATICGFAAAELVGWIGDKLGPITEATFHPGAARERELAARAAFHALEEAGRKQRDAADDSMRALWSQSISSIKAAYLQTVATLTPDGQNKAVQILGFAPNYDGIAKAIVASGGASTPLNWAVDQNGSTVADRLRANKKNGGSGCESTAAGCLNDGYSEVCPFSFNDFYMAFWNLQSWKGSTRDQQMAFDRKMIEQMQIIAGNIFQQTQQAIASVMTKIAVVSTMVKQQELLDAARAATRKQLASKAAGAASVAEAAADAALKGNAAEGKAAIARANNRVDVATAAYKALLEGKSACGAGDQDCIKAAQAVDRARAAAALAVKNAAHAAGMRVLLGAGAAAAAAAGVYFLLKK